MLIVPAAQIGLYTLGAEPLELSWGFGILLCTEHQGYNYLVHVFIGTTGTRSSRAINVIGGEYCEAAH